MNKVLVICGPTCVGKTSLSIELAKKLNAEIINGDSMQVYKGMNIGTAKITKDEMEGIPHHLFDIKEVTDSFSVAEFQKLVREKIEDITKRNKLPIIVGGTGLYLKAALYDYTFNENKKLDLGLEEKSNEELYKLLLELDPKTANTIHINNKKRIIRALEIYYENGQGKIDINNTQQHKPIYDVYYLGLTRNREVLYKLIDERVDIMVKSGLIEEAKTIYETSAPNSTCRQAIGYKELNDYFNGLATLDEAITKIKSNTHKFVKRQYTWFNHQVDCHWVDVENKDKNSIINESLELIKDWIK